MMGTPKWLITVRFSSDLIITYLLQDENAFGLESAIQAFRTAYLHTIGQGVNAFRGDIIKIEQTEIVAL